jgi:hypothetical protein
VGKALEKLGVFVEGVDLTNGNGDHDGEDTERDEAQKDA